METKATVIGVLQEQGEHHALAWGCVLCRTVIVGPARRPAHDCRFDGEVEPLVPVSVLADVFREKASVSSLAAHRRAER